MFALAVFAVLLCLLVLFPLRFLTIRQTPIPADAIIVLGGDVGDRTKRALELVKQGYCDRILLTGQGKLALVTNWFNEADVSLDCLHLELEAGSTYENAKFSEPVIRKWGSTNVLLVTSDFHSRRTLSVFQRRMPGINFVSVPSTSSKGGEHDVAFAMRFELIKLCGYWVVYKIPPWPLKNHSNYRVRD